MIANLPGCSSKVMVGLCVVHFFGLLGLLRRAAAAGSHRFQAHQHAGQAVFPSFSAPPAAVITRRKIWLTQAAGLCSPWVRSRFRAASRPRPTPASPRSPGCSTANGACGKSIAQRPVTVRQLGADLPDAASRWSCGGTAWDRDMTRHRAGIGAAGRGLRALITIGTTPTIGG